jgi:hypothetical protein
MPGLARVLKIIQSTEEARTFVKARLDDVVLPGVQGMAAVDPLAVIDGGGLGIHATVTLADGAELKVTATRRLIGEPENAKVIINSEEVADPDVDLHWGTRGFTWKGQVKLAVTYSVEWTDADGEPHDLELIARCKASIL